MGWLKLEVSVKILRALRIIAEVITSDLDTVSNGHDAKFEKNGQRLQ